MYSMDAYKNRELLNETDVLDYFVDAINFRNSHKDQSTDIATQVFNRTHATMLPFTLSKEAERLRFEFGALEAPGMPEDETLPTPDYDDEL